MAIQKISPDEAAAAEAMLDWFADEEHWIKGTMGTSDPSGPVNACLLGGAQLAVWGGWSLNGSGFSHEEQRNLAGMHSRLIHRIQKVVREQFPERAKRSPNCIIDFNDHIATTIEDIRVVLEKTRNGIQEER